MPLIHPFTHTFTHQRQLAAMQGTNQLVRSDWGLGVSLRDTSTRPGWDRTGNPPTARRLLLPPEPLSPPRMAQEVSEFTRSKHTSLMFVFHKRAAGFVRVLVCTLTARLGLLQSREQIMAQESHSKENWYEM